MNDPWEDYPPIFEWNYHDDWNVIGNEIYFAWYQPKYNPNYEYFKNDFRINPKDKVQFKFDDNNGVLDRFTEWTDGPVYVMMGAASLTAAAVGIGMSVLY